MGYDALFFFFFFGFVVFATLICFCITLGVPGGGDLIELLG